MNRPHNYQTCHMLVVKMSLTNTCSPPVCSETLCPDHNFMLSATNATDNSGGPGNHFQSI